LAYAGTGRRRHDGLIVARAAGDVDQAIQVTTQIWRSLEDLAVTDPVTVLYARLGGQPAINAYSALFS